ncbi:MAG: hypothetical protein OHK0032_00280 [Thermodesulfovibrionales bacterium]
MFKNRLIYRLFLALLIFALAAILPIGIMIHKEFRALIMEVGGDLKTIDRIIDNIISISFYIFILAFLLALFLSRRILMPVKELHRGAMSIRDGNLDVSLSTSFRDELGEVIEVFNEMTDSLRDKTEKLKRKNVELTSINSIAAILSHPLDDKNTIRDVVNRLVELLDMDDGGVFLIDRPSKDLICYQTDKRLPAEGTVFSRVIETGEVHTCEDITKEGITPPEWMKDSDIRGCCAIPLKGKDRTHGVLYLVSFRPHIFTDEERRILTSVGEMTGMALENIWLYEEMTHLMLTEKGLAEVVFNSISDGVYTVDTDCVITSMNRAGERILGIPARNLIGRKCMDVIAHLDKESDERLCGMECPLYHAIQGTSITRVMDYVDPSGRRISLNVRCSPLIDAKGSLIGAVQVFRDITREREIDMMKTEFVKTVSHEFRTPLSAIIGMTEMLIEGEVGREKSLEYLNTILNEGARLSALVSDLLDISRIESGEGIFNEGDVDFNLLLHDIKKTLSDIIRKKGIRMETHVTDDVKHFRGDRDKLMQLLMNLIANSINYSDSGCLIDVNIGRDGEAVRIEVSDTGWGIPAEDIPFLTKKFFRGKHGIKTKGTGLGLYLCKEITQLHGGSLNIKSRLGSGTTVTVELPWKEAYE